MTEKKIEKKTKKKTKKPMSKYQLKKRRRAARARKLGLPPGTPTPILDAIEGKKEKKRGS